MKVNIIKEQMFDNIKFDFIITLTYVLMDNFCPFFKLILYPFLTTDVRSLLTISWKPTFSKTIFSDLISDLSEL